MGAFLLDQLVEPMREFAITAILRAYRPPSLPLPFVAEQLGFAGDDAHARVANFAAYVALVGVCAICNGRGRFGHPSP